MGGIQNLGNDAVSAVHALFDAFICLGVSVLHYENKNLGLNLGC
jgi:hypothetical protein